MSTASSRGQEASEAQEALPIPPLPLAVSFIEGSFQWRAVFLRRVTARHDACTTWKAEDQEIMQFLSGGGSGAVLVGDR